MKYKEKYMKYKEKYISIKNKLMIQNNIQLGGNNPVPKDKILIVMGNGPSLKDQNFNIIKQFDSFGLNAAYRAYNKMNFWPTYFGCFDFIVSNHHTPQFKELIKSSPIKKFFFINQDKYPEFANDTKFQKFNFKLPIAKKISISFDEFSNIGTSGTNAVQVGIMLGYKKIILLGCDCNYIEQIDGANTTNEPGFTILKMNYTPTKNTNYWFDDYQQKGDVFNLPRKDKVQMKAWNTLFNICPNDVEIVNCSNISQIPYFRKSTLEKELQPFQIK